MIETRKWADVEIQTQDVTNSQQQVVGKRAVGWTYGDMLSYSWTAYDAAGRVEMTVALDEQGYEWPTSYEYDGAGKQTVVIDPCGHDITHDVNGEIVSAEVNDLKGHRTETQYEGNRRKAVIDALGNTTEFEYDVLGRVIKTKYPETSQNPVTYSYIEYDGFGRKTFESQQTAETNPANAIGKTFEYDVAGMLNRVWLPEVIDPCTSQWTEPNYIYEYDDYGNMVLQIDPKGRQTLFTYDYLHNQTSRELPGGEIEDKYYDDYGRLVKHTNFDSNVAGYVYDDERGFLSKVRYYDDEAAYQANHPDGDCGLEIAYTYDNLGRRVVCSNHRGFNG